MKLFSIVTYGIVDRFLQWDFTFFDLDELCFLLDFFGALVDLFWCFEDGFFFFFDLPLKNTQKINYFISKNISLVLDVLSARMVLENSIYHVIII